MLSTITDYRGHHRTVFPLHFASAHFATNFNHYQTNSLTVICLDGVVGCGGKPGLQLLHWYSVKGGIIHFPKDRHAILGSFRCTPCPSKFDTRLSNVITLSNIGRFSNFFSAFWSARNLGQDCCWNFPQTLNTSLHYLVKRKCSKCASA